MRASRVLAILVSMSAALLPTAPAAAFPDAVVVTGTMTTGPLFDVPINTLSIVPTVVSIGNTVGWSLYSGAPSVGSFSGAGSVHGGCQHLIGSGTVSIVNLRVHTATVTVVKAGQLLVMYGMGEHGPVAFVGTARADSTNGPGACILYGATSWSVIGTAFAY